ncbi:MAG: hypothetical protein IT232_06070, partial [Flavobacteriales bacterium]|nr:hypothetical protein [Flavobacteriales bacterium]
MKKPQAEEVGKKSFEFFLDNEVNLSADKMLIELGFPTLAPNVLQLPEGGDFGALHCKPSRNFDRSTKFDLTTEPPLLGRCCY